jgi:hypothetical protein
MDESRLDELRSRHDRLTPKEVAEKLELFERLSTTGRRYTDITITNTLMPLAPSEHEEETPSQRLDEKRFTALRERPFDLSPYEERELRTLYARFGTQPARYARGVTLHGGR